MKVNGNQVTLEKPITLLEYLKKLNYDPAKVAVELDYEIVPKDQFDSVVLNGQESLEIVGFVGGG